MSATLFLGGVALALAATLGYDRWLARARCGADQARRLGRTRLLFLGLLLYPFATRAAPGTWLNLWLDLGAYVSLVLLLAWGGSARLEPLLAPAAGGVRRWLLRIFPAAVLLYCLALGLHLTGLYRSFHLEWCDYAFEFAPLWQSCRYGPYRMINEFSQATVILQYHWPLFYLPLSPLARLWSSPLSALWISTGFFAAAAVALYFLARHWTRDRALAAALGILFLLYLPVHLANLFDFHADPLAMPFIFLAVLFAARRQWWRFFAVMALALSCKEYVGLVFLGLGLWLMFRQKEWVRGGAAALLGLAWLVFVVKRGIPHFNQGAAPQVLALNYGGLGGAGGVSGMARYGLSHPAELLRRALTQDNVTALVSLFLPFLFLPFLRPAMVAAGGFVAAKNLLAAAGLDLHTHRETLFFPFVVMAFLLYFASLGPGSRRRFVLLAVCIGTAATYLFQGQAFPSRGFWHTQDRFCPSPHHRVCARLVREVPPAAPVMASSHLAPHLMNRQWYYLFPRFPCPVPPEYVLVDTLGQAEWDWLPRAEQRAGFRRMLADSSYRLQRAEDGIFLFKLAETPP